MKIKRRVSQEQRRRWLGTHPRITYLPDSTERCEAIKYGQVPLYALFSDVRPDKTTAERDEALRKARCKKRGIFRFRKAKRSTYARDGLYCWTHLAQQIDHDDAEHRLWERWQASHVPEWDADWQLDVADLHREWEEKRRARST